MPTPIKLAPLKNSTLLTEPSASVAEAIKLTAAGATKVALAVGAVSVATGSALTIKEIAGVVVVDPLSSVAFAVTLA